MERKRILLAIGNSPAIQDLKKSFSETGYEVKLVHDGAKALTQCREFRPHLVLAELALPGVDGHHLLREVKSHASTKHISFVLMSDHRSVEERVHSINLGCDDYVTTPFDIDEVVLRLGILLKEIEIFDAKPRPDSKGFSGKLRDLNLIDLLHTLNVGEKTAIVTLQNHQRDGLIFVRNGEVIEASLDNLPSKDALFRMFTWGDGGFRVDLNEKVEQKSTFDESHDVLVKRGLLYRDRWLKVITYLPPLQTFVKHGQIPNEKKLSESEKSVLGLVRGQTRLDILVEKSKFDDLSTLRILAKLYSKGNLVETTMTVSDLEKEMNGNGKNGAKSQNGQVSNIIDNFLKTKDEDKPGLSERRRRERRQADERRIHSRRWADHTGEENEVFLNKSELIMIREKVGKAQK